MPCPVLGSMMVEFFLIIIPAIVVGAICRVRGIAASLPLIAVGALVGLLRAVDHVHINPEVLLTVVLPPLLFGAALSASFVGIRQNLAAIGALSVGLVVVTAGAVTIAVHLVNPALSLAAALTLGAVLAPADSVATTAVARRVGMKRGTQVLLDGENLLNDGAALTIFNVAVAIVVTGSVTVESVGAIVAISVLGGVAVGVGGGLVLRYLVQRIDDAGVESTMVVVAPYCVFLVCEWLGASGFLAVVLTGLILSRSAGRGGYATRLQVLSLWSVLTFLMESIAFVLVGFEFIRLLKGGGLPLLGDSAGLIVAVLGAVVLTRVVWVMGLVAIPHLRRRVKSRGPITRNDAAVVAWAGMRGPVSVFAALSIPLTLDDGSGWYMRDQMIFVATCVVIATLVLQGTTLGPLMRRLGVAGMVDTKEAVATARTISEAREAANDRLVGLLRDHPEYSAELVDLLQQGVSSSDPLSVLDELGDEDRAAYRQLRVAMIEAERMVCFDQRAKGEIGEASAQRLIRRLDLQEAAFELE